MHVFLFCCVLLCYGTGRICKYHSALGQSKECTGASWLIATSLWSFGDIELGQYWFKQWPVARGHKTNTWPMLANYQWCYVTFTWGRFHGKCPRYLSLIWVWKLIIQYSRCISRGPTNKKGMGKCEDKTQVYKQNKTARTFYPCVVKPLIKLPITTTRIKAISLSCSITGRYFN